MQVNPERIAKGMWWDRAWSLVEGCSYVSLGCDNCWSAAQAHMRAGQRNEKIRDRYEGLTRPDGSWNGKIRLLKRNLDLPLRVKKPTIWAVWNDLFHELVPDKFISEFYVRVMESERLGLGHTFLVLTKRPERMAETIRPEKPLKSLWLGVTAEDQGQADKRIPVLLQIPAAIRFVSVEPMLSAIDFTNTRDPKRVPGVLRLDVLSGKEIHEDDDFRWTTGEKLDWVICGGETGPGARPTHPDWVRSLRDQCQAAEVPFFFKQWGEWLPQKEWLEQETNPDTERNWLRVDGRRMYRVGKKVAGRLLDGWEWNQFPEAR